MLFLYGTVCSAHQLLYFFSLQSCVEVEFLYFGLSFYHLKAMIDGRIPVLVDVDWLSKHSQCTELLRTIKGDLELLCASKMGGKKKWESGDFMKVS